jgi:hypothetical protein
MIPEVSSGTSRDFERLRNFVTWDFGRLRVSVIMDETDFGTRVCF